MHKADFSTLCPRPACFITGAERWAKGGYPSGVDGEAVVFGEVGVGGVSVGLEAMGACDRRGEIVRNHQLRDAVKEP